MAENLTPLMFSVSIEQLDKKLKDWTEKIAHFANNGGKGYKLKIDFGEAESVIRALKNLKIGDTSEIERMQKEIDGLKKKLKELNDASGLRNVADNITKPLKRGADESKKVADEIEKSKKRVVDAYTDMIKSVNALQMDRAHARGLGVDISSYKQVIADMKSFASEMSRLSSNPKFLGNSGAVTSMMAQYDRYMQVIRMLRTEINGLSRTQREQSRAAEKQKLIDKRSVNEAIYQIDVLEKKIASLQLLQSQANKLGVKTPNLDKLLQDMDGYMQKFATIFKNGGHLDDGTTAQMLKAEGGYRALTARIQQNTQETRINIAARNSAVAAVTWLAGEEIRLAQAISQSTSALHGQSQTLQDLKSLAAQYISVWGAKSFIDNIIEKGGQLEQQRLSIGAILGDTAHATDLFSKVKNLAIKSPFGVTELDAMTKQLSAFGFEYSELFDLTKRLADVSAATGTHVDRLALALGHVRSETALTGYTLRQFSMANVPLLQKLSEKFGVTPSQIRKMVSRKEIGYEDVLNVLKDLTNQGGPFFEAQETMSNALNAKFKNLRDSYEIMFNEIAESGVGGGLKDLASILTTLSRHWEELFTVVGTGLVTFGAMKGYMALVNSLLGANAVAVMNGIKAYQRAEIAYLRLARSYRDITLAENAMIATTHKWTASERFAHSWIGRRIGLSRQLNDAQRLRIATTREQIVYGNALALSERRQTTEDLARQVALGKTSKAQARQAIILSDLTRAEKSAGIAAVNSVRTYGAMTGVVNGLSMGFVKLGAAMKSLFLNPQMALFALLAGVMELWQRNKIEIDRAKQLNDDLFNRAMEGIKNIRTMMETTGMTFKVNDVEVEVGDVKDIINGKFTYKPSAEMSTQDMIAQIDQWTQFIKEYAATPNRILNEAFKDSNGNVRSVAEQYDLLAKSVSQTAEAYVYLKQVSGAMEYAENSTNGGWLNDSFITNINDYSKAVKRYNDSVTELVVKHSQSIDTALGAARGEKTFADALRAANAEMVKNEKRNLTEAEQLKMLIENQDKYTDAIKAFEDASEDMTKWERKALGHAFHGSGGGYLGADGPDKYAWMMKNAYAEMEADANKWATNLKAKLTEVGWDFNNLSESQKMSLALAITEMVSKADYATEDIRESVKKLASEKFGIKLDVKTLEAAARINALEQSLKDLVGHDWHIDIKTATNFGDVISKIRQDYKAAQDYFNNVKPLMIKMGVDVSGGMKELGLTQRTELVNQWKKENPGKDATIFENMLADYDSYAKKTNDAMGFNAATGISLSDPNSGGKTFRDKQPSKTDKELELWRKRIQLLEKYRQELAQLEKLMTRAQAESKLKSEGDFAPLWSYFTNPNDFDASLDEAAKKIGSKTEERKVFVEGLGSKKSAESLRKFKENISFAVSELERLEKIVGENYDTYKKWLQLTGDPEFAARIAGVVQNTSYSDWLKDKMREEMKKVGNQYTPDQIFAMSESEVKKFGKDSAIYKIWDAWQENRLKIEKESATAYENAIKNAKDYATQIAQINGELAYQNELISKNSKLTEAEKSSAISRNTASAQLKIMELSADYKKLFGDSFIKAKAEIQTFANTLKQKLNEALKTGAITAKEYSDKISAINKRMRELDNQDSYFESYMKNGLNGIFENMIKRGKSMQEEGAQKYQDAQKILDLSSDQSEISQAFKDSNAGKAMMEMGEGMEQFGGQAMQTVAIIDKIVHGIDGLVQGLNDAFQQIREMYTALGYDTNSDFWEDANTFFSSFSSASSSAAKGWDSLKNGDVGGVISGVVGSFTGWITGFAKGHDKKRQNHIDALMRNVDALEANTAAIQLFRRRTLGYDTGKLRRYYANTYKGNDAASNAMRQFYNSNTGGSGYKQELANLQKEREAYMQMYNEEDDKKNSSEEALLAYQQKISELDDQIRHFAEDIANELWKIDTKGWADQMGDALMTAFENGESAIKAFDEAAKSIMQSVVSEMLKIGIIEPMMERLRNRLFGYTDNQGNFHNGVVSTDELTQNPLEASEKMLAEMAEYFKPGGEGSNMAIAAQEYLTGVNRMMEQMGYSGGLRNKDSSKSNTLSASIQGIKEETADLLAGYMNAERQDVAVIRLILAQYLPMIAGEQIGEGGIASVGVTPSGNGGNGGECLSGIMAQLGMMGVNFSEYHTAQLEMMKGVVEPRLSEIAASTNAIMSSNAEIMSMLKEGRGAMFEKVGRIDDTLHQVTLGIEKFAVT